MLSGTNVQVLHIVNKYTNQKMVWIPGLFTGLGSYLRHNRLSSHTPVQWQYQSKGGMSMNINYIRVGDYYIPDLTLTEESRPIGRWGRMHRDYLREHKPIQYNCLLLSGKLWTYLADLNEQAQDRLERMIDQMKVSEGISEALKASDPMAWVQRMNNIRARAEEIVREELIYV